MGKYAVGILWFMLFMTACKQNTYTSRTRAIKYALLESKQILDEQVQRAWRRSEDFWIEPMFSPRGEIWFIRTKWVKAVGVEAIAYLDSLQNQLLVHHKKPADILWPTKDDAVFRVYSRLEQYKNSMIAAIKPEDFNDNPRLMAELKKDIEKFKKVLPLLKARAYRNEITNMVFDVRDWNSEHFWETSPEAALLMLEKLKNDVRMSVLMLMEHFGNMVGRTCGYISHYPLIVQPEYDTVFPAQTNTIRAAVGDYYPGFARPRFYIRDSMILPDSDGNFNYRWKAPQQPGNYTIKLRHEHMRAERIITGESTITYTVAP